MHTYSNINLKVLQSIIAFIQHCTEGLSYNYSSRKSVKKQERKQALFTNVIFNGENNKESTDKYLD